MTEHILGKFWYDTNSASSESSGILTAFFHIFERVLPVKFSSNINSFWHTAFLKKNNKSNFTQNICRLSYYPLTVVKEGWQSKGSSGGKVVLDVLLVVVVVVLEVVLLVVGTEVVRVVGLVIGGLGVVVLPGKIVRILLNQKYWL